LSDEHIFELNTPHIVGGSVKFIKMHPEAKLVKGSEEAAAWDLVSIEGALIGPEDTRIIHTGIHLEIPPYLTGIIASRSGLGTKGVVVATGVSVIDPDYRGEILVPLYNRVNRGHYINKGDRIAQIFFIPRIHVMLEEVQELSETERGEGGFGSSGK
jgi:dUTP pyrophosphatase